MEQAKNGDSVRVHYTGRLDNGTIFDSSTDREPLEFTLGEGEVIPGFESAVVGMTPGQVKTAQIPFAQAYGAYDDDLVMVVARDQFPPTLNPEVGQQLQLRTPQGQSLVVQVTEVTDQEVTLDGNHPLAGKDLAFEIELIEIVGSK